MSIIKLKANNTKSEFLSIDLLDVVSTVSWDICAWFSSTSSSQWSNYTFEPEGELS